MCIAFLSFYQYEGYPLILLNNRDEETTRPTIPLHEWDTTSSDIKIYGGKDKVGGGTWLATNNKGKFCMVLNSYYKSNECFLPQSIQNKTTTTTTTYKKISRGKLVYDYLNNDLIRTPLEYIEKIELNRNKIKRFIMVLGDINNNLKLIFNNNNQKHYQLNNENYESLLNIMLTQTIENEINVPMENINVSFIFVLSYTSKFTNLIHSTISTSLITIEEKKDNEYRPLMNFIQIDHTIKEKFILSKVLHNK